MRTARYSLKGNETNDVAASDELEHLLSNYKMKSTEAKD